MKRFRISCDPIRFRDLYCVSRRGRSIRIEFFSSGNTTGKWASVGKSRIVQGFALYADEPAGWYGIKVLQMVETAICQRMSDETRVIPVSGTADFELASTLAERRALLREFIAKHLEVLTEVP